ncbi:MAG: beta-propeller fold lactonase family protein, partial [Verrucomicrobia bacterium]|nr:beta-propeller fold lactonase family protein [Verrucomicrobiota bacterium]
VTLVGPRLTVFHNGVCIHNNLDLGEPAKPGPILLQGDHGKVSYRNLKIKPLSPDYAAKGKVYVLNSNVDDATVISIPEHEIIGQIKVGANPHGIEANAAQTRLFISAEGEGFVNVIDPTSDKVLKRIPVGPAPNEIASTPDGRLLYVPSGSTGFYEAVDLEQGKIVAKIKTGGSPHNVVCSADGQHMFLSPVGDPHKIFAVETSTHRIVCTIPLATETRPIVLRRDKKRLYVQRNELVGFELIDVSDVNHCRVLQTVHLQITPEQQKVPRQPVPCHGIALTPDEKELWVCDANHDIIAVFDVTSESPRQLAQIPAKRHPVWLTFSPDGKYGYITNRGANEVQVVETATRKTVKWINLGEPERLLAGKPGMHVGGAGKGPARILAVTVAQF